MPRPAAGRRPRRSAAHPRPPSRGPPRRRSRKRLPRRPRPPPSSRRHRRVGRSARPAGSCPVGFALLVITALAVAALLDLSPRWLLFWPADCGSRLYRDPHLGVVALLLAGGALGAAIPAYSALLSADSFLASSAFTASSLAGSSAAALRGSHRWPASVVALCRWWPEAASGALSVPSSVTWPHAAHGVRGATGLDDFGRVRALGHVGVKRVELISAALTFFDSGDEIALAHARCAFDTQLTGPARNSVRTMPKVGACLLFGALSRPYRSRMSFRSRSLTRRDRVWKPRAQREYTSRWTSAEKVFRGVRHENPLPMGSASGDTPPVPRATAHLGHPVRCTSSGMRCAGLRKKRGENSAQPRPILRWRFRILR